jgi:RND family efflux transporter MFP subunit
MATDQVGAESYPAGTPAAEWRPSPASTASRRRGGWGVPILIGLVVAGLAGGGYYFVAAGGDRERPSDHAAQGGHGAASHGGGGSAADRPRVEVVRPRRGGMERTTNQPGTVRAFDFAQLYAKVSGYVKELRVDRGSRVKMGDPLIELDVPELLAAVEQAKASLARANASVVQAEAKVNSAKEMINAKLADLEKAETDLRAKTAYREYRDKQYERISQLVARGAVEERLKDEEEDRRAAAREDEAAAKSGVAAARAHVAESRAFLAQAHADLKGAEADVNVSKANLDKELALESYTHIKSPYDGVIIFRGEGVHKGAFVRSADEGMGEPMLTVAMDSSMRTIIPVPDRDVPFCDIGDPVIVRVDALAGREFKGTVSRMAESEDVNDRTMRVEVDLPNEQHVLRDGMYGRAEIILEKATSNLTVPSTAVLDRDSKGKGTVQVIRDGKIYKQAVLIGRDTGTTAEIVSGLQPDSDVVAQPDVSTADGTAVDVESGTVAGAHKVDGSAHS